MAINEYMVITELEPSGLCRTETGGFEGSAIPIVWSVVKKTSSSAALWDLP